MPRDQVFSGRTEDAEAPFLDAAFWKQGVKIHAHVDRSWESENGECYVLNLQKPVIVKIGDSEEEVERVSVGNMTGFRMALDAARCRRLLPGDFIELECTGVQKAKKAGHSPRPNFAVKVTRSAKEEESPPGY